MTFRQIQFLSVLHAFDAKNRTTQIHNPFQYNILPELLKRLPLKGDRNGHFVCVIQGDKEVDLKMAAKISGNKNCDLIPMKDLLATTGYIRGGCTPIGMKKTFPTFIDDSCLAFDYIYISAGQRGLQLRLSPTDLIAYTRATTATLSL